MNYRAMGLMLLMAAAGTCLMMFVYLVGINLGSPSEHTTFSFWLFCGLTVVFSVAGGCLLG